jgi:hypothetical protein
MAAKNNDILYNAAISGITAVVLANEDYAQINATSLASTAGVAQQAQIADAATAVDAAIPNDAALSVAVTGVMSVAAFGGGTFAVAGTMIPYFTNPALLAELCFSAFQDRSVLGSPGAYTTVAAGIAAQYAAAVLQMQTS